MKRVDGQRGRRIARAEKTENKKQRNIGEEGNEVAGRGGTKIKGKSRGTRGGGIQRNRCARKNVEDRGRTEGEKRGKEEKPMKRKRMREKLQADEKQGCKVKARERKRTWLDEAKRSRRWVYLAHPH